MSHVRVALDLWSTAMLCFKGKDGTRCPNEGAWELRSAILLGQAKRKGQAVARGRQQSSRMAYTCRPSDAARAVMSSEGRHASE